MSARGKVKASHWMESLTLVHPVTGDLYRVLDAGWKTCRLLQAGKANAVLLTARELLHWPVKGSWRREAAGWERWARREAEKIAALAGPEDSAGGG